MLNKVYQYYRYLLPYAYANRGRNNLDKNNIISIFSVPRGGSTWLSDLMCQIPSSALVWEPLYLRKAYPSLKKLNFSWNQYIPDDEEWPEAKEFFRKLYNREIVPPKLYFLNKNLKNVTSADYFIYKCVNSNLIMPWLSKQYNINPIFILRHPCAVVASQLNYRPYFDHIIENPQSPWPQGKYTRELYERFSPVLKTIKTPEERLAADWAITNIVPLKHPRNHKDWITVPYEQLYMEPAAELTKIFNRLNISIPAGLTDRTLRPSGTAIPSSFDAITSGNQLTSWKTKLSTDQIQNILRVTHAIGMDMYDESPLPKYHLLNLD